MTWCTLSSIAFAWGFLTLVGLCLMPYESHRASNWSLNSFLLSWIMCWQQGYLLNQVLLTKVLIMLEDLSKYTSLVLPCDSALVLVRGSGKFHYRQFYGFEPAGSWINHSKAHEVNFKSTHTASQGVMVTSLVVGSFHAFVIIFYLPGRIDSFWRMNVRWNTVASSTLQPWVSLWGVCFQGAVVSGGTN